MYITVQAGQSYRTKGSKPDNKQILTFPYSTTKDSPQNKTNAISSKLLFQMDFCMSATISTDQTIFLKPRYPANALSPISNCPTRYDCSTSYRRCPCLPQSPSTLANAINTSLSPILSFASSLWLCIISLSNRHPLIKKSKPKTVMLACSASFPQLW